MKKFNEELLRLVAENPNHELQFFVADDVCEYHWTSCEISDIRLEKMALYDDEQWLNQEDYEERLYDELADEYENDDTLKEVVDSEMGKVDFKDYICVFLV